MAAADLNHLKRLLLYAALAGIIMLPGCSERNKTEGEGGADKNSSLNSALKFQQAGEVPFVNETRILATILDNDKPVPSGSSHQAATPGKQPQAQMFQVVFSERGNAVAYKAERGGSTVVVLNGKAVGRTFKGVGPVVLSPNGQRYAYTATDDNNIWHLVTDTSEDIVYHHIGDPVFSADSRHIAYVASANEDWYVAVDNKQNKGGKYAYDQPVFSSDGSKLAYIENIDDSNKKLHISDLDFNDICVVDSVAAALVISPDKKRVAVVVAKNKKKQLVQIRFDQPDVLIAGPWYDSISKPNFGADEHSITYAAGKGKVRYIVLNDREERIPDAAAQEPIISFDLKTVGAILFHKPEELSYYQAFAQQKTAGKRYNEIEGPAYSKDGSLYTYAARKGNNWFAVVNGIEGPPFDRVVPPLIAPDGKQLIYRARKDGKRFVVVADVTGKTIRQLPVFEQVFQPVFSPDGKSFGYGVKDGNKLIWMVEKL